MNLLSAIGVLVPMLVALYGFGFAFAALVLLIREPNALIDKHLTLLASAMYNAREIHTALELIAGGLVEIAFDFHQKVAGGDMLSFDDGQRDDFAHVLGGDFDLLLRGDLTGGLDSRRHGPALGGRKSVCRLLPPQAVLTIRIGSSNSFCI